MNLDPALQMFITTCCANCTNYDCEGAFNMNYRTSCEKYISWQNLTATDKSKLFMASMAGELTMLEDL